MPKSVRSLRGFTLIELMVVISIIGILATVGLVIYSGAQKNARDSKRVSDMQEIQKALEQYYAVNNAYPANSGTNIGSAINSYFENGAPPTDPSGSSNPYVYYHCSSPSESYLMCATLESSKGNAGTLTGASCTFSSGTTYYCAKNLSN